RTCFQDVMIKKFKTNITRARENKRELETYVLSLSGGPSSMVMLDLVDQCIGESVKRARMFFKVHVVHIDQSCLWNTTNNIGDDNSSHHRSTTLRTQLTEACNRYKLPLTVVPLENIYGSDSNTSDQRRQRLLDTFNRLDDNTAKEDLLDHFRNQLVFETTQRLGYNRVLNGSSSNRLAIRLLASTSKGRGHSVPNETNLIDQFRSISICHPMRDFWLKEVTIYHRRMKLIDYTIPSNPFHNINLNANKCSINTLCENFLNTLQDISSQTIHTLLRSVDKLHSPMAQESMYCSICSSSLTNDDIKQLESSVISPTSTTSTTTTTTTTTSTTSTLSQGCGKDTCCSSTTTSSCSTSLTSCCSSSLAPTPTPSMYTLCYSCRLIVRSTKNKQTLELPSYVNNYSKTMMTESRLRNEIKDFLLNDDDDSDDDQDDHVK
ncbi:hypothetical protein SAMD00019534_104740, partial [Acytostelium subglobosum LB1]|uniref:hypothetical protein n=1 Tax=Acytostelium subglobosum LB1 TaxID=1410327 RepID=UPI000644DCC2